MEHPQKTDEITQEDNQKANEIFISYRRADVEFTQKICGELERSGFTVWFDLNDIPPGAERFDDEIQRGIEGANAFLCILSPRYLASPYCMSELQEAARLKKKVVPIVLEKFDDLPTPPEIEKINWVYFTEHAKQKNPFEEAFPKVIQAIQSDYEHSREHTRLLLRAIDWQKNDKGLGYVLKGSELDKAERWQVAAADKIPPPTELHSEYILASRKDATRRQRNTITGVAVALVVSILLGTAAVFQWREAVKQAAISRSAELAAQSTELRDKNFQLSLLLGIEGYRTYDTLGTRKALLDATNGSLLRQALTLPQGSGVQGAFSPDGKTYASANEDHSISFWDVSNRKMIGQPLQGHRGAISALVFSNDGQMLVSAGCTVTETNSVCSSGEIRFWNVASQQIIGQPISGFGGGVRALALTPDGKTLATLYYHTITIESQTIINGDSIVLWDTTTHQPAQIQPQWPEGINRDQILGYTLSISQDGKTLAAAVSIIGSDGLIAGDDLILWDMETGRITEQIQTNDSETYTHLTSGANKIILSPDGNTIIVSDWWAGVTLWDVNSAAQITAGAGLQNTTTSIALSKNGKTLAVATFLQGGSFGQNEGVIEFRDTDSLKPIGSKLIGFHLDQINTMTFSPDGNSLFSGGQSQVNIWNSPGLSGYTSAPLGQLAVDESNNADPNNAMLMAFSPDGNTLAVNNGTNEISFWDTKTQTTSKIGLNAGNFVYSPDGGTIAAVNDKGIILWDVAKQQSVELPMDTSAVQGIALGPNAQSLISYNSASAEINIWDISNPDSFNRTKQSFAIGQGDQQAHLFGMALSPTGKIMAVSTGGGDDPHWSVSLWDMDTHKQIGAPVSTGHNDAYILQLEFSADGSILALSDGLTTTLWDVATHNPIGQPFGGGHPVLTSDNSTLALIAPPGVGVDYSAEVSVWDVATHQIIGQPLFDPHAVIGVAISPDGKTIASMGRGGEVTLWDLNPDSWVDLNCQRVGRNLTQAEWNQYGFTESYRKTCDQWPLEGDTTTE